MNPDTLNSYFHRIGLSDKPTASLDSLKQIHRLQHKSMPFENFDVVNGKAIKLTEEALVQKLVRENRGGYCFELNGLLYSVLNTIGFQVRPLLGRVHLSEQATGRGHRVNLVTIDDKQWLVDAGFGAQTPREPLPLELNKTLSTDIQTFRFIEDKHYGVMLQTEGEDGWSNMYSLDMGHVCQGDIDYGNHYTSTSPDSVFTNKCVASLRTESGAITLLNNRLKIKEGDSSREMILNCEAGYFAALKEYFGIAPDVPYHKIEAFFDQ
ncbi:arylamine N-acetyltransferase family protein [Vibrio sp. SCSIO 43137]|uniref:arylamine N-acetyltransferase family protein n=1 Tax=Vibrio sp. SCSIO 43137 TaxID=3021011 RepID=UPI002307C6CF|nr:arylamine N-acetyltransferase [Vibrio sp. SCSIO 43137]WCE31608.1 arylamine N-acetyltransferase [Vibrio sp. SCSIO 43137]